MGGSKSQHGEQRGKVAAAMAEGELGFEVQFGHGVVKGERAVQ